MVIGGLYALLGALKSPERRVVGEVFDIVPRLLSFSSVRDFIRRKLDFFTALFEFTDH